MIDVYAPLDMAPLAATARVPLRHAFTPLMLLCRCFAFFFPWHLPLRYYDNSEQLRRREYHYRHTRIRQCHAAGIIET